ncbi:MULTISPECIES: hypothetical protein [Cohaesibacter]|uniref:hypothetical protein n=1 Tax=Cohaesibacter TaxID=655352 RepID=UPI0010FEA5FD|nr:MULTISPECIES: hypothetical protein [Cohaesibacter]TLP43356.1 hypothetical protein FDK21_17490 [Cohaesibacter sp. CAU 1516]
MPLAFTLAHVTEGAGSKRSDFAARSALLASISALFSRIFQPLAVKIQSFMPPQPVVRQNEGKQAFKTHIT